MNIAKKWNDYWFGPGRTFDLALIRVVLVGLQCFVLLSYSFPTLVYTLGLPEYLYQPRVVLRLLMPWTMPPYPGADQKLRRPNRAAKNGRPNRRRSHRRRQ